MPYGSTSSELVALAGGDAAKVEEALNAGAAEIDAAFAAAGYGAPIAYTSSATEAQQTRLDARLAYAERAIAMQLLSSASQGKRGTGEKAQKDAEEARRWLDRVRSGREGFPYVTASASQTAAFAVAGSDEWPVTAALIDRHRNTVF